MIKELRAVRRTVGRYRCADGVALRLVVVARTARTAAAVRVRALIVGGFLPGRSAWPVAPTATLLCRRWRHRPRAAQAPGVRARRPTRWLVGGPGRRGRGFCGFGASCLGTLRPMLKPKPLGQRSVQAIPPADAPESCGGRWPGQAWRPKARHRSAVHSMTLMRGPCPAAPWFSDLHLHPGGEGRVGGKIAADLPVCRATPWAISP